MELHKTPGRKKARMTRKEWDKKMPSVLKTFKKAGSKPGAVILYDGIMIYPREIKTRMMKVVNPRLGLDENLSSKGKHILSAKNFQKYAGKFEVLQRIFPRVKSSKKVFKVSI